MDYPVLVNPGKPFMSKPAQGSDEEENPGGPLWNRKTP